MRNSGELGPPVASKAWNAVPAALMDRASELACSGDYEFLYQIERTLVAEGLAKVALLGKSAAHRAVLRGLLAKARGKARGTR